MGLFAADEAGRVISCLEPGDYGFKGFGGDFVKGRGADVVAYFVAAGNVLSERWVFGDGGAVEDEEFFVVADVDVDFEGAKRSVS